MDFFQPAEKGIFLERPNRFTMVCRLKGEKIRAYLPNPGRMWELLLPGATVYLERVDRGQDKMPYTAVAVDREGVPVWIHTHRANVLAQHLITMGKVPGLEGAEVVRREVQQGRSRFDFLLHRGREQILLEVKSCTLFGLEVTMFPDAVTARGRRHVEELSALEAENTKGGILFLVFWPRAKWFLPEFHTDPEFARALLAAREKIFIIPLAVGLRKDLSLAPKTRLLTIPWDTVEQEVKDRGSYLLILQLARDARVEIGQLGNVFFRKGYYIYIGSAQKNLTQRIQRHRRVLKKHFWHIDYLRAKAALQAVLPIRTQDDLECAIARSLRKISDWEIPHFGSSDCSCHSHLFGMTLDPRQSAPFISLLQYFRMDRLVPGLQKRKA